MRSGVLKDAAIDEVKKGRARIAPCCAQATAVIRAITSDLAPVQIDRAKTFKENPAATLEAACPAIGNEEAGEIGRRVLGEAADTKYARGGVAVDGEPVRAQALNGQALVD